MAESNDEIVELSGSDITAGKFDEYTIHPYLVADNTHHDVYVGLTLTDWQGGHSATIMLRRGSANDLSDRLATAADQSGQDQFKRVDQWGATGGQFGPVHDEAEAGDR
jgi:hypothetical protein